MNELRTTEIQPLKFLLSFLHHALNQQGNSRSVHNTLGPSIHSRLKKVNPSILGREVALFHPLDLTEFGIGIERVAFLLSRSEMVLGA